MHHTEKRDEKHDVINVNNHLLIREFKLFLTFYFLFIIIIIFKDFIYPKPASNEMFAPWGNHVKTAGGNGTKKPLNTSVRNNTLQGLS